MAYSFTYWDDCVDPEDLEAMWNVPEVSVEWLKAGEEQGQKVHLSRDPDGQPYLTQTEMRVKYTTLSYDSITILKFGLSLTQFLKIGFFSLRHFVYFQAVADIVINRHFQSEINPVCL